MDVLRDPELKSTYDKCKLKVKVWEHEFRKKMGRPPSKLDIKEARSEVRNAYKTYYRLKTAALEESLMNIEGFESDNENEEKTTTDTNKSDSIEPLAQTMDDSSTCTEKIADHCSLTAVNSKETWGSDITNKKSQSETSKFRKETKDKSVNLSFSQKLFEGSKSSKRLPRKSLSFNRKKSEVDFPKPSFLSQPEPSSSENTSPAFETLTQNYSMFENIRIAKAALHAPSQPLNFIQNTLDNSSKAMRSLDSGWMHRVASRCLNSKSKDDSLSEVRVQSDSEDIIDNSEEEMDVSCNLMPPAKKFKESSNEDYENELISVDASQKRLDFSNIFNKVENSSNNDVKEPSNPYEFTDFENKNSESTNGTVKSNTQNSGKPVRRSARKTKPQAIVDDEEENEDPFHTDDEDNDLEYEPAVDKHKSPDDSSSPQVEAKGKKRRAVKSKVASKVKANANETDPVDDKYELEYSIKSRIQSVPRIGDLKKVLISTAKRKKAPKVVNSQDDETEDKLIVNNKNEKLRSKLQHKVDSGKLNDNFVQLNIKKKIFVRGKKTMTNSKFKKQQWKKKKKALSGPDMDMGGCDGGVLKCFQCGEAGHFARQCPVKGDTLLPREAAPDEEPCPYPTLEEAAQMAKASVNVVRKTTLGAKEDEDDTDEIDNSQEEIVDVQDEGLQHFFNDEDDALLLEATIRLENEISKINMQNYLDSTTTINPYFNPNADGSVISESFPTHSGEIYQKLGQYSVSNYPLGG